MLFSPIYLYKKLIKGCESLMIFTNRVITIRKAQSIIDEPIIVYRGDYEIKIKFTIMNSKFKFMSGTNLIESENAAYGQLGILTPYGVSYSQKLLNVVKVL